MKKLKYKFVYLALFVTALMLGYLVGTMFFPQKADATFWCHNKHSQVCVQSQNNCIKKVLSQGWDWGSCPVPTPTPTVEPTATPTPISECQECVTPTPTPVSECEDCVTPTPTREPEPTSAPQPLTQAEPGPAPKCSEPAPVVQPKNFGCYRSGAVANCEWIPGDESVVDIFYSEGKVTTPPTSWPHSKTVLYWEHQVNGKTQIGSLVPGLDYTFALRSRNACSGGQFVYHVVVDSDTQGMYFPLSYWYLGN